MAWLRLMKQKTTNYQLLDSSWFLLFYQNSNNIFIFTISLYKISISDMYA